MHLINCMPRERCFQFLPKYFHSFAVLDLHLVHLGFGGMALIWSGWLHPEDHCLVEIHSGTDAGSYFIECPHASLKQRGSFACYLEPLLRNFENTPGVPQPITTNVESRHKSSVPQYSLVVRSQSSVYREEDSNTPDLLGNS